MTEPPQPLSTAQRRDRTRLLAAGHRRHAPAAGGRDPDGWSGNQLDALLDAVRALDLNPAAIRLFGLPMDRDHLVNRSITALGPRPAAPTWPN